MLLDDIKQRFKLPNLEVKDNNYEDIFNLYKSNEAYAKLSNNYPTTLENVIHDVDDIPPFVDPSCKHFISIYTPSNELVAVVDLIDNYSFQDKHNPNAIWIGLLAIANHKHHLGLGNFIINTLLDIFKQHNKRVVQLGVIKQNTTALNFWTKSGFKVFREESNDAFDLFLMEKFLVEGTVLEPLSSEEYNTVYDIACRLLPELKGSPIDIQCFYDYSEGTKHKYSVYALEHSNQHYILKKTGLEEVEIYTNYLHNHDFKVPKFYGSVHVGEDYWLLTDFITGCNGKHFTAEIAQRLAKNLSDILNAHWIEKGITAAPCTNRFDRYWDRINTRKKCLSKHPKLLQAYELFLERQQTCPISLCNGDLMQINIIATEDDVYIIDWAFGGFMPYALEVARIIAHGTDEGVPFYMTDNLRALFLKSVYDQLVHTQLSFEEFCYDIKLARLNEHIEFLEYNFNHPQVARDTYFELDFSRANKLADELLQ